MAVDSFTKFVWAKPTRTLRTSEVIEKLDDIFSQFGYPRRIIHDAGRAFTSDVFRQYLVAHGVLNVTNAIATPRANGQVERPNRTIVEALTADAESEVTWDVALLKVVWGVNNTVNTTTRFSPSQLMFSHDNGVMADLGGEPLSETNANGSAADKISGPGEGECTGPSSSVDSASRGTATEDSMRSNEPGTRNTEALRSGGNTLDNYSKAGRRETGLARRQYPSSDWIKNEGDGVPVETGNKRRATRRDPAGSQGITGDGYQVNYGRRRKTDLVNTGDVGEQSCLWDTNFADQPAGISRSETQAAAQATGDSAKTTGGIKRTWVKRRQAATNIESAGNAMKRRYDRRRRRATIYKVGDLVLWRSATTALADKGVNRKLSNKYDGPYKVMKDLGNDRYEIVSLKGVRGYKKFRAVVAVDSLKPFVSVIGEEVEHGEASTSNYETD